MIQHEVIDTPLGPVFIGGSDSGLHLTEFVIPGRDEAELRSRLATAAAGAADPPPAGAAGAATSTVTVTVAEAVAEAARQLRAYFLGARTGFELPLAPRGTPFQQAVWRELRDIRHGETTTYGAIAKAIGRPTGSRAVGAAVGRNPLAVVVPCHRVIGAAGALTGYASGLDRKRWLLTHEAAGLPGTQAGPGAPAVARTG